MGWFTAVGIQLFTIGFAGTRAADFFGLLRGAGVARVIDVRLHNTSQLAGFTKKDDLRFFLQQVGGIDYLHLPALAPTEDMLDAVKKRRGSWPAYEAAFAQLMVDRSIERVLSPELAHRGCLLCSEKRPDQCHRRLIAEYLQQHWPDVSVTHLV